MVRRRRPNRQQGRTDNQTTDQTTNQVTNHITNQFTHPPAPPNSAASNTPPRGRARRRDPPFRYPHHPPSHSYTAYAPVPPHASINPGTPVSIVQKQDQRTGHQVQGFVSGVLTRGNHERGVKVRLRDGRVGRVQRLVSDAEGLAGEGVVGGAEAGLGRGGMQYGYVADVRGDGYLWDENRERSLGEYFGHLGLEEREQRYEGWGAEERDAVPELMSAMVQCPVCANFEGDARAVAHHVEGHYQN